MEGIMEILKTIQNDLSSQKQEMKCMEENIKQSINSNINEKFLHMDAKIVELENRIEKQQETIDFMEKQARKRNIILFGVEETEQSYSGLVTLVLDTVTSNMGIICQQSEIEEVRRLGRKADRTRPIVITFTTLARKIDILKMKKSLEGSSMYVKEDFPPKVIEKRKSLQEELKREREAGKKVVLRYDKIVELKSHGTSREHNTRNQKRQMSESPEMCTTLAVELNRNVKQVPKKNKTANIMSYLRHDHSAATQSASTSRLYTTKNA